MINFKENETVEIEEDTVVDEYDYMNEEPLEDDEYEEQEHDYCD